MTSSQQTPARDGNNTRWVWFITGPTASGKTTVAKVLAEKLGFTYVEGDDYHPDSNRTKMANNQPLTDADRASWLRVLREQEFMPPPGDTSASSSMVIACSALKKRYRDELRVDHDSQTDREKREQTGTRARVRFVFLDVDEDVLKERARKRKGHYAKDGLVESQMRDLERPGEGGGEEGDVVVVRVERGMGMEEVQGEVLKSVQGVMKSRL